MVEIVLVPSPLLGPASMQPLADAFSAAGAPAEVVPLEDSGEPPFAAQHIASVARALAGRDGVTLLGHSGAGPLLPGIAAEASSAVDSLVFVDAGLPYGAEDRTALFERETGPGGREQLLDYLDKHGAFPHWSDEEIAPLLPDPALRRAILAEVRPRALPFWTEPIHEPPGWERQFRCAYVQLSSVYYVPASRARTSRWAVARVEGDNHFSLATAPEAVVEAVLPWLDDEGPTNIVRLER